MHKNNFFEKLGRELQNNPFKERFMQELEDHAEDLMSEQSSPQKITFDFMKKHFGTPKEIKKSFIYMMRPWLKIVIIMLYGLSMYTLFLIWKELIAVLIQLGDINLHLPPQGIFAGFINIFYNTFGNPYIIGWDNSQTPTLMLLGISMFIFYKRIKNKTESTMRIFDHLLTTNFIYIGIIVVIMSLETLEPMTAFPQNYNLMIGLHLTALFLLFYTQHRGLTLEEWIFKGAKPKEYNLKTNHL